MLARLREWVRDLQARYGASERQVCFCGGNSSSLRDECLNVYWFLPLKGAQEKIEGWRLKYNQQHPHSSLNNQLFKLPVAIHGLFI
ncbi:integrase core domain-containing protein [Kosakonia oryziphila]|uniref:integrase core domain-containing protein n=1 Tax=Kosakonia oryziphila TaxID=1005667 RepID=UPI00244662BB|nr:integrase core domain-containing protein [Kosakonia oryziphila]